MMLRVIFIELDFDKYFQKYMTYGMVVVKLSSKTSLCLEDIPDHLDFPEDDNDTWGQV